MAMMATRQRSNGRRADVRARQARTAHARALTRASSQAIAASTFFLSQATVPVL